MSNSISSPNPLYTYADAVNTAIGAYHADILSNLSFVPSQNGIEALSYMREFSERKGKRIRGSLAIVGYEMFGGTDTQVGLDLSVVVELTQDYLLMVDDVMDRSAQRRGGDSVHAHYQKVLALDYSLKDSQHTGNMIGINVGLIAQHLAAAHLSRISAPSERIVHAQQIFQRNIAATGFGQLDDLFNEVDQTYSLSDMQNMYILKSSYYTFVNPLQLGAVLAGASEQALVSIEEFGQHAGLAFQLRDDLIGMFGDEAVTGKSVLDDLREGKMTLLMRHALQNASVAQHDVLYAALGNENINSREHDQVKQILEQLGSREYVDREASKAVAAASAVLEAQKDTWSQSGRTFLAEVLTYSIRREK